MDIATTTAPKSDQQNFDDYLAGPKTVTISEVTPGSAEQPVEIHLEEFPGRPFKPSKSMRRVLVAAWGQDSSVYVGRRMTLYGDPSVKFGGVAVGGIRVSHLSHIDAALKLQLTTSRGKRDPFVVQPLPDAPDVIPPSTKDQQQRIRDLLADVDDKAGRVSAIVGRTVATVRDLDTAEASALINALEQGEGTA